MKLWRYGHAIEQLGQRYRLERPLGSGGMADVCLAWDEQEQFEVAIKVIKAENLDQRSLDRFLKEIAQVVRLDHPHILHVYTHLNLELLDIAHGSIVPYIVMEYAPGGDLQQRLRAGRPYALAETVSILVQICEAVQYAHEQGVIHRDLKPHNILFRPDAQGVEQAMLSDFGLAVEMSATHHTFASGGTLAYMAPEQFRGQAQAASDIFSLGVVLYQLLTGMLPFRRSLQDLVHIDTPEPPIPASQLNPEVSPVLDEVLTLALAADPTQRLQRADLFAEMVQRTLRLQPDPSGTILHMPGAGLPSRPLWSTAPNSPRGQRNPLNAATAPTPFSPFDISQPPGELATDPALGVQHITGTHNRSNPYARASQENVIQLPTPSHRSVSQLPVQTSSHSAMQSGSHAPSTPYPPISPLAAPATRKLPTSSTSVPIIPGHKQTSHTRRPNRRTTIIRATIALLLLVGLLGTLTYFGLQLTRGTTSTTHIVLTPASRTFNTTFDLIARPNPTGSDLQTRTITTTSQSLPQSANATGQGQIAGKRATGKLTFLNGSNAPYVISNNMPFSGTSGTQVELDSPVTIPAADPNTGNLGTITGTAHAIIASVAGNIAALDINNYCCVTGKYIYVKNTNAFTGGQDARSYAVVQQSDIAGVSDGVTAGLVEKAKGQVANGMGKGERQAGDTACEPQVQSDHQAGDQAAKVTVQVTVTCSAIVYDGTRIAAAVTPQLTVNAAGQLGSAFGSYALVDGQGKRTTLATVVASTVRAVDRTAATVTLRIQASGTWLYQISADQVQQWKSQLAGKSVAQARDLLSRQPGITAVDVQPATGTLPADAGRIEVSTK